MLLLFVLSYQKKAEEAHRILEGLGPRVELVSEDFDINFIFLSLALTPLKVLF